MKEVVLNAVQTLLPGFFQKVLRASGLFIIALHLFACSEDMGQESKLADYSLQVYKTPSCGCCGDWVAHMKANNFSISEVNQKNIAHVKERFEIPINARSCHTASTVDGFVFEGHVPAKYIRQFLESPPEGAYGLTVPGMPVGSPGMEVEDKFKPYSILMLMAEAKPREYVKVESYQQQF